MFSFWDVDVLIIAIWLNGANAGLTLKGLKGLNPFTTLAYTFLQRRSWLWRGEGLRPRLLGLGMPNQNRTTLSLKLASLPTNLKPEVALKQNLLNPRPETLINYEYD